MKKLICLPFIIMLFLTTAQAEIPSEELAALDDLYQYTNGDNWNQNDHWNDSDACNRFGVTCNTDHSHVVGINLFGNNLQGKLPESLKNLSELNTLILVNNIISGGIPSAIANLEQLAYLDFSGNYLSGTLPTDIWKSANLIHLNLSNNQLSGELQSSCNPVAPLQIFNISNNAFTGTIPDCLGQITTLSGLYLSDNQFSGEIPSNLSQLQNLNYLYLDHNKLEGDIPTTLGELNSLQYFRLSYNMLSGTIPDEIGYLYQLKLMDLSHNRFTGKIPGTLGNLNQLERLYLNDNALSETLPSQLGQCTQLKLLFISSNKLQGPIPEEFLSMTALQDDACEFRWNALWTNNTSLQAFIDSKQNGDWLQTQTLAPISLYAEKASENSIVLSWEPQTLSSNEGSYEIYYAHQISGTFHLFVTVNGLQTQTFTLNNIESGVSYYFKMKTIVLPHNNNDNRVDSTFSEKIPISILSNFPQIEREALIALYDATDGLNWTNQNGWMGTAGSECGWFGIECNSEKNHVISINLPNNNLKNELPQNIQILSHLERMDLRNNQLSGQIPEIISNLTNLKHLDLSANSLSGNIPDCFEQLNALESLILYDNQLSGVIPTSLGLAASLKRLYLEKNHLSGNLPKELALLDYLEKIRVHSNQLMGQIPDELLQLKYLEYGTCDFRWNGLYTTNQNLIDFLNERQRYDADWTKTQNIPPTNLRQGLALTEGLEMLWSPISYSVDSGYYEIEQSISADGPFQLYHSTSDKSVSSLLLTDLNQNEQYFFRIRTCTQAHANNKNALTSLFSPVITVIYALHLPWISDISDQTMLQDSQLDIPFSISDDIVSADSLEIEVQSSNTGLIPLENLTINGEGKNRLLHVTSVQNHVGDTEITLIVKKEVLSTQSVFTITVLPSEDTPPQPTGLHAVTNSGYIQLAWDIIKNPYGVRYNIYRSTELNGMFKCIHSTPVDENRILIQDYFIDPNVINGQLYVYKLRSELNSFESLFSNAVQVIPENVIHIKGDMNGDQIADIKDLVRILQVLSDVKTLDYFVLHTNAIGNIGLDDAVYLFNKLVK